MISRRALEISTAALTGIFGVVVVNKGGGSGAEGYVYGKASAGDPYKLIFGTSNA